MQIHLRFLTGMVTVERPRFTLRDIYLAVKEHTADPEKGYLGSFHGQAVIRCQCEEDTCEVHNIQDGDVFNIFIKPIFEIPYVNSYDVSQFYMKNGDAICNHLNEIIWVNISGLGYLLGGGAYEVLIWDAESDFVKTQTIQGNKETCIRKLRQLYDSDNISAIAKERLNYICEYM